MIMNALSSNFYRHLLSLLVLGCFLLMSTATGPEDEDFWTGGYEDLQCKAVDPETYVYTVRVRMLDAVTNEPIQGIRVTVNLQFVGYYGVGVPDPETGRGNCRPQVNYHFGYNRLTDASGWVAITSPSSEWSSTADKLLITVMCETSGYSHVRDVKPVYYESRHELEPELTYRTAKY